MPDYILELIEFVGLDLDENWTELDELESLENEINS